ncbi:MAG TPA: sigma-54 dependent transcriptional regulator [Candidatus Polarisedimenticolia bacterium]|jgi:DNA-binding NtrC family response regulator|nr:sigma-54 dependent transcriptional regulator [Candidatus Polarisedimenticolia bacterium]
MKNILVAEDDRTLRDGLVQSMSKSGYKVQVAQSGKDALERIEKQVFDLVISGHRIGGADGLEILRKARSTNAGTLVIVTGENGSGAVEAMRSGAFDYVQKPLSLEAIEMKVQRAMEHQRLVVRLSSMTEPHADPSDRYGLVGQSAAMREIFKMIDKVAASNATVLIQGETGTGKERVAEAIHRNSPRHDAAFVRMNCASLPDNLLESELFGHEKGAFTGADQMRIGRFEMANDGTLFLDEVGNMSANTQAKVLRAIQNQEFERLGGNRTIKVDVRIVAATNINLEAAIKEGRFREDLFYRLNVVNIMVPALRERVEDIVPLAEHFIKRFARELRRRVTGFSADAVKSLQEYRWPGNVRELENSIERAVLMCEGDSVRSADLTLLDREHSIGMTPALAADLLNLEALEKTALLEALKRSNWIQKEAAKLLGVSSRVMNYKVHKHGITHDRWSKNRN